MVKTCMEDLADEFRVEIGLEGERQSFSYNVPLSPRIRNRDPAALFPAADFAYKLLALAQKEHQHVVDEINLLPDRSDRGCPPEKRLPRKMICDHDGDHRFYDRHDARAEAGIMAPLDLDRAVFASDIDRPLGFRDG